MPETASPATSQRRFRTSKFPGFFGGTTDPATGNLVPQQPLANPNAAPVNDNSLPQPTSGLVAPAPAPQPEPKSSPGLLRKGVAAGAEFAGATIGKGAGSFLAANPGAGFGDALGAGVGELGSQVSNAAASIGLGSGAGEAAAAAGAAAAGSPAVGSAITDVGALGTQGSLGVVGGGGELGGGAAATSGLGAGTPAAAGSSAAPAGAGGEVGGSLPAGVGGAIGAGVGTFVGGLILGQSPVQALKSGAGSGIGFAIGFAVGGGPIGGFIGSVIGSLFGGRVICTELMKMGLMERDLWATDMQHARAHMNAAVIRGYHFWGIPVVRLMRRDDWLGWLAKFIAIPLSTWRAEEISFVMHSRTMPSWKGRFVRWIGEPLCWVIGQFVGEQDVSTLYKEAV